MIKRLLIVFLIIVLLAVVALISRWASMNRYIGIQPETNPAMRTGTSAPLETLNPNAENDINTNTDNLNNAGNTNTTTSGNTKSDTTNAVKKITIPPLPAISVISNPAQTIADNVSHISSTVKFTSGLKKTGLTNTLKGTVQYTVFAPTDAAFTSLPKIIATRMNASKANLIDALTYHIVQGRYTSADLKDGMTLKTIEGQVLRITITNGQILVNNAPVQTADIMSSNGVMFIVGAVLIPAS